METLVRTPETVNFGRLNTAPGFLLRLAQLRVYEQFFSEVGEHGLKPGEFSVLWVIRNNPGIRQSILGQSLMIKRAHMTKLIRALEDQALLYRNIPDEDRRAVEQTLTAKGQEEADIASEWFFAYEEGVGGTLTQAERDQLLFLLRKFIGI